MNAYEQEFQLFSSNIHQAARSFYYHREIQRQVYDDGIKHQELPMGCFQNSKMFQAMNANAQFWNDYKYSSLFYAIVILGRIFDRNKKSHGIRRLTRIAKCSGLFTKEELKKRKIAGSENAHEWIDAYMEKVTDIRPEEYYRFLRYIVTTGKLWDEVKDVRNKLYAHQDVISAEKKSAILEKAKYDIFEKIIFNLLKTEEILWEVFHNGKKPDVDSASTKILDRVRSDVSSLLSRLSQTF